MALDGEYDILLGLFVRLVQTQFGKSIPQGDEWLNDIQTLATKMFRHLASVRRLSEPGIVVGEGFPPVHFIDHSSVLVLTRAAFENYLVFFHLFGDPDRTRCKFRHNAWVLAGLTDRQGLPAREPAHIEQLASELRQIAELKTALTTSPFFTKFTPRQGVRVLSGDWRIERGWQEIAVAAGFHQKYFLSTYSFLCGYSHSSYLSALQVGQAGSVDQQFGLTQMCRCIGLVLMSHFAFTYAAIFGDANGVLVASTNVERIARKMANYLGGYGAALCRLTET